MDRPWFELDGREMPEATRRLKGETLPVTIPGDKRSFLGKIFGRKAA